MATIADYTPTPPDKEGWYWARGACSEFVIHVEERGGRLVVPKGIGDPGPVETLTYLVWGPRVPSPDELEAMEEYIAATKAWLNASASQLGATTARLNRAGRALKKIREADNG